MFLYFKVEQMFIGTSHLQVIFWEPTTHVPCPAVIHSNYLWLLYLYFTEERFCRDRSSEKGRQTEGQLGILIELFGCKKRELRFILVQGGLGLLWR